MASTLSIRFPLELIDIVYTFADIDTKLNLRKVLPHFRFTQGNVRKSKLISLPIHDVKKSYHVYNRTSFRMILPIHGTQKQYQIKVYFCSVDPAIYMYVYLESDHTARIYMPLEYWRATSRDSTKKIEFI